jgi:hypothetical protein
MGNWTLGRNFTFTLLLSIAATGCISYATEIKVSAPNSNYRSLSEVEVAEIAATVGEVATRFGFRSNPRLAELERMSEASKEYRHHIVADYITDPDFKTHGQMILTVGVEKETGQVSVLIRDLEPFPSTKFKHSLTHELSEALAARFSPAAIKVEERTVGPNLGP